MVGFFPSSTIKSLSRGEVRLLPGCGKCGLYEQCLSPKMPVAGEGRRRILVVGEAPGAEEDQCNRPFVGKAGKRLAQSFKQAGVELFRDCWITNCIICRPPDNRNPSPKEIEACRPNLNRTIKELKPDVIIPLGRYGVQAVVAPLWGKSITSGARWNGWRIPCQELNAWVCPAQHPSYILRMEKTPIIGKQLDQHIEAACEIVGKPWGKTVPDYSSKVERIYDEKEVCFLLWELIGKCQVVSFDFETDRLKPDHPDARIVCCAVSNGVRSFAYPWVGEAITATSELLRSNCGKIGWNIKYEERWARRILGHGVNKWVWDGMQAAHMLDNREGVTSLKFQAFVQLGQPNYNQHIEPYLLADDGNSPNRITEIDLDELLLYNGLDALLTYTIATKQRRMFRG